MDPAKDLRYKSNSLISKGSKPPNTFNNGQQSEFKLLNHLDIEHFKTKLCTNKSNHNQKHCFFFHDEKDKKRLGEFYSSELCKDVSKKSGCPKGDKCFKSHNRVEQLFRKEKYKTKFCSNYPGKVKRCEFGPYCCFSHSEKDLAIEPIHNYVYDDDFYMFHYKTVWCPFNLNFHDKSLCVYAHNWQDFRRRPDKFDYEPIDCKNWKISDYITLYEKGCAQGYTCKGCHGWKELEYHPLVYRTKPCPMGENCRKRRDCTNFHNASEKREINALLRMKITKLVPRNRIVSETFKKAEVLEESNRRVSISDSLFSSYTKKTLKSKFAIIQDSILSLPPQ